jgi:hypothetical protein
MKSALSSGVAWLLALSFLIGPACQAAPTAVEPFAAVRTHVEQLVTEGEVPSMAVAVARDGEIVWEAGFGLADRERGVPATAHTLYPLASISKPLTATALMILVERGLVDLDRPIDDYLGEAKLQSRVGDAADATVRRVACHTAGLLLHAQRFYDGEPQRPPPMDETIRRYGVLVSAPGERWQYSNLGWERRSRARAGWAMPSSCARRCLSRWGWSGLPCTSDPAWRRDLRQSTPARGREFLPLIPTPRARQRSMPARTTSPALRCFTSGTTCPIKRPS